MSNWVEILLANGVDGVAARSQLPDEADVNFILFPPGHTIATLCRQEKERPK